MTVAEFWQLRPFEFWLLVEAKRRENPQMYGDLTEDQVAELYERAYGNEEK